ncbi:MAG: hypothetical protein V2A77_11470, partial [Pseudomonadota bacterium]
GSAGGAVAGYGLSGPNPQITFIAVAVLIGVWADSGGFLSGWGASLPRRFLFLWRRPRFPRP